MTGSFSARVMAPAKINLGLEILGRRADGFHEIRSVLAMVELEDEIRISRSPDHGPTRLAGVPGVAVQDNLIMRAVSTFTSVTGLRSTYDIRVTKRIPAPAGLGSASSNGAATLLALNALHGKPLADDDLHILAADLGSDVPFFLGTPVAAVSGRGTEIAPLPNIPGVVLIAVPRIELPAKTTKLYGLLGPDDYSDGGTVASIVTQITRGERLHPALFVNAFERPLRELAPETATLVTRMREAGCPHVVLSGAGPAHFAIFDNAQHAESARAALRPTVDASVELIVAPFRTSPVTVVLD